MFKGTLFLVTKSHVLYRHGGSTEVVCVGVQHRRLELHILD